MRIGIDARKLSSVKLDGIGTYLVRILDFFNKTDTNNEYYLYSNKEFKIKLNYGENFYYRLSKARLGTLWVRHKLPKLLKRDGINVFWGPEHVLPKRVKGIKYIVTIHDLALLINSDWGQRINSLIQRFYVHRSIKCADKIIAISQSTRKDLIKLLGVPDHKIVDIYNGGGTDNVKLFSPNEIENVKKKYGIEGRYLLYVGTIEPRKNIETIIKSFEKVCQIDNNLQLVLAGGLGWKYKAILESIKNSNFFRRIVLTGYVSDNDKCALYASADLFIFPSHYEGFGLPVLEALKYGVPVITAVNSSLKEVGGQAAFYLKDENNYCDLTNIICTILSLSFDERSKVVKLGKEQAKLFSWDKCGESVLKLLTS